ncbi:MAG: type II toxin-antitoxin system HicB family antitoxin [Balneolaceae bacterium]
MKLKVVIHKAEEGGYWAEVPALPGCISEGDALEEMKANIREAIELYLDTSYESIEPVKEGDEILELSW